jgi:hypothetical protein
MVVYLALALYEVTTGAPPDFLHKIVENKK